MNRTLLARTRQKFYAEYRHAARRAGCTDEAIARAIADMINDAKSLLEGKCPKCGAPSTRYVDRKHQQGISSMPGVWVMYRCSTQPPPGDPRPTGACDFMIDIKESDEAN